MVQAGEHLSLSLEPCETVRIFSKRLGQDLQRHLPVQLGISGLPHFAHPTFTNLGGDFVVPEAGTDV